MENSTWPPLAKARTLARPVLRAHSLSLLLAVLSLGADLAGNSAWAFAPNSAGPQIYAGPQSQTLTPPRPIKSRTGSAWNNAYATPCACDQSFADAFPANYANRLGEERNARFLEIEAQLIDGFTQMRGLPNAEKHIFWSVYELGAYDVANALIRAAQAGVKVQVLTDGKSVTLPPPDDKEYNSYKTRGVMTRDVYALLTAGGVEVAYSNPEFKPVSTSYPPLMHEKVRLFARGSDDHLTPLFAYVSTHNDTYSDTIGDPISTLSAARLRKGALKRTELVPGSYGNVQTAFVLRHADALQSLLKNFQDQFQSYGQGTGRITNVPTQKPLQFELHDGTRFRVAYTYAKTRSAYNPNQEQVDFLTQAADAASPVKIEGVRLQQFVFSFTRVSDALRKLTEKNPVPIEVLIDGNFAYQPYSQGRKMAGLFSVAGYRPRSPIEYPWPRKLRDSLDVRAYVNGHDKLHTKNTLIRYRESAGAPLRYRVYTGSLNLSSNGVSNKEVMFEIDSPSDTLAKLMDEQLAQIKTEPNLKPLADSALYNRLRRTAQEWGGPEVNDTPEAVAAFDAFLSTVKPAGADNNGGDDSGDNSGDAARAFSLLSAFFARGGDLGALARESTERSRWTQSLGKFFAAVGDENVGGEIVGDVEANLNQTPRFRLGVSSVEILMALTEDKKTMSPNVRDAVLKLFQ